MLDRAVTASASPPVERPLLRGVVHLVAFVASVAVGVALVVASQGERRQLVAAVFAASVTVCFGTSALYHRVTWAPATRLWIRRLDHAGVFLLIAGTYTPVCVLV